MKREAAKYNDNSIVPQAIRGKVTQCKTNPTSATLPGNFGSGTTVPGGTAPTGGTGATAPGTTPGSVLAMSDPAGPSDPRASSDTPAPDSQTLTLDLEPAPRSRTGYIVVAVILVVIVLVALVVALVGRNRPATRTMTSRCS